MKPSLAILLHAASAFAVLSPGTECGNNRRCDENCELSLWTIGSKNGGYVFVCDPSMADGPGYYSGNCDSGGANEKKVCEAVGGEWCSSSIKCLISASRSVDMETRDNWDAECKAAGASGGSLTAVPEEYFLCGK